MTRRPPEKRNKGHWRDCRSKRRFASEGDAQQAIARARRRSAGGRVPLRIYWCPHCSGFHLTSQEAKA